VGCSLGADARVRPMKWLFFSSKRGGRLRRPCGPHLCRVPACGVAAGVRLPDLT
jgi:hypothetical protein